MGNSTALIKDLRQNTTQFRVISHDDILEDLLEQLEEIDFELKANPKVEKLRDQLKDLDPKDEEAKEIRIQLAKQKVSSKQQRVISVREILAVANRNRWGLCKQNDMFYLFNGEYWKALESGDLKTFLGKGAEKLGVNSIDAEDYRFRDELLKQFETTANLEPPQSDKVLINLLNGTYEIGEKWSGLREFRSEDFLTYQLPFEYDEKATAPTWQKFLDRVLPDIHSQMVLAEYLGYIFIRNGTGLKLEKILVLYGAGQNGKSVVHDVVKAILGEENVSHFSLEDLTEKNSYQRAEISDKLLNYSSELSGKINPSIFKQLASGESLPARRIYGSPFSMSVYAKVIVNANVLPKSNEQTEGYFRRFMIIPFIERITEEEKEIGLADRIAEEESSGIFNWILEGMNRLKRQGGFTKCTVIYEATERFRREADNVKMFLDEKGYKADLNNKMHLNDLYDEYKVFCFDDGYNAAGKKEFSRRIEGYKFMKGRDSIGMYFHLSVKIDSEFNSNQVECPF